MNRTVRAEYAHKIRPALAPTLVIGRRSGGPGFIVCPRNRPSSWRSVACIWVYWDASSAQRICVLRDFPC